VWEDGVQVQVDAANGYSYDAASNSVTLNGSSCDKVKNQPNTKVQVIYGCPTPPIS